MEILRSLGLQALAVGVLLVLPLIRPSGRPLFRPLPTPVSLGRPLGEPPAARVRTGTGTAPRSNALDLTLRMPTRIPNGIPTTSEGGPPQITGLGSATAGNVIGDPNGVPGLFTSDLHPVVPVAPPPARVAPVRISHMSEGDLGHKF